MSVFSFSFDDGDVIVIETQPSPFPPIQFVRFKGKSLAGDILNEKKVYGKPDGFVAKN